MAQITTHTPKPNEFAIPENEGYAITNIEISEAAEFLMTKLEPVKLEDLGADDRECAICQAEFVVSEDAELSHVAVKTVCGHIFGKDCIMRWLQPLGFWSAEEDYDVVSVPLPRPGNSSCPMCRQVFFAKCTLVRIETIAERFSFWDMAYASAGVARSEREERSRKYLLQHIEYCRSINLYVPDETTRLFHHELAQELLLFFVDRLEAQTLTPEQESLRRKLKQIGRTSLTTCGFENHSYVFNFDSEDDDDDDERAEVLETDTETGEETPDEEVD